MTSARSSTAIATRSAGAGSGEHGFAWIEGDVWRGDPSNWEEASRLGACGLALGGRRRLVHSSVSGYARLYWIEDRGATYFASQVDPLVRAWPRPLSIDWDAWAATIILRHPVGGRTPFAEIRRLGPHAALGRRLGRSRIERPAWPWAEIEPRLSLDAGADAWVAALRESLGSLQGELICPLSGGRDSRMLLCAVPADREVTAITVDDDEGGRFEEDHAAPVARALGVEHEELRGRAEAYPRDWDERARRVEYQFVDHAWLVPLAQRIAGARAPVLDGGAIDCWFQAGESLLRRRQPRHQPSARRERGDVRERAPATATRSWRSRKACAPRCWRAPASSTWPR